jgi:hypothetical protein
MLDNTDFVTINFLYMMMYHDPVVSNITYYSLEVIW